MSCSNLIDLAGVCPSKALTKTLHLNKETSRAINYLFTAGLISFIIFYLCVHSSPVKFKLVKAKEVVLWKWKNANGNKSVKVLVWSSYFYKRDANAKIFRKILGITNMDCRDWCEVVGDRKLLNESDALVFHGYPGDTKLSDMPHYRNPNQPWVWWNRESPYITGNGLENFNHLFNWTMTYRQDSDLIYSYGHYIPIGTPILPADLEWLSKPISVGTKTKMIAAVISNCDTPGKREKLIKLMKRHGLAIDIYGRCGVKIRESDLIFWQRLAKEYKFYLAFENALCKDYVTEKLWRTLTLGIVPLVYGGADYTKVAPPNSFIDVRKFTSINEVVKYLHWLGSDEKAYGQFFEWRKGHRIFTGGRGFCELCEKMILTGSPAHTGTPVYRQTYTNLAHWWKYAVADTWDQHGQIGAIKSEIACSDPKNEWFWKE